MGTGFRVWGRNIVPFVLLTAICYVPMFLWTGTLSMDMTAKELMYHVMEAALVMMVLNIIATGTITYGVVMELQGKRASIGQCIAVGFKRMLPVIGVGILAGLAMVVGLILLIVPGVIIACMLYVAVPAAICEKPGITGALKRSSDLTRGYKGQIFGILLIFGVINWASGKIVNAAVPVHDMASARLQTYVSLGLSVLVGSLTSVMAAVAYYYLRSEQEGTTADQLASVFE